MILSTYHALSPLRPLVPRRSEVAHDPTSADCSDILRQGPGWPSGCHQSRRSIPNHELSIVAYTFNIV